MLKKKQSYGKNSFLMPTFWLEMHAFTGWYKEEENLQEKIRITVIHTAMMNYILNLNVGNKTLIYHKCVFI